MLLQPGSGLICRSKGLKKEKLRHFFWVNHNCSPMVDIVIYQIGVIHFLADCHSVVHQIRCYPHFVALLVLIFYTFRGFTF